MRAFADSNGDGVGDFRGLTSRLDYLQDLGVTALWLLPFYPSPLKDDGYDIADYTGIHPQYGTMRDFRIFLREAHARGLKVITELVINHTSDQHPWFQRARRSPPGSRFRDFYVWSDSPERYADTRIIFKDFETSNWQWDGVAGQYFWHRFYSQQPDLNFDSPHVRRAVVRALDFWLGMGVDGLRLDAIPYLYEREGTTCENLPETHAYLRELRRHVDSTYDDRMLLAEANQWPEDAIAYFGEDGDECHMSFHFPLMPRLFMAIRQEDRFPIIDILQQTPPIPDVSQWAVFLRNHDELTLEMVTDEERDYMYRVYAHDSQARINLGIRRRLAPLLQNDRRKIELMNGLLFSLPGTPVLYYGDEIGMGDNIYLGDRNGVRTPMQWSNDRNAGFSAANPQKLFLPVIIDPVYHYETVNVETQRTTPHSLLWWMKRLVGLRKRHPVFGRGSIEFLAPENRKVLAYLRRDQGETVLVVANLSRSIQAVELDLHAFRGHVPTELFGRTRFPPIGELPYFLTLGPYAFYWFSLQPERMQAPLTMPAEGRTPTIRLGGGLDEAFSRARPRLEAILPVDLRARRWFAGKARTIQSAELGEAIPVRVADQGESLRTWLALLRVEYTDGEPETYVMPLAFAAGERADAVRRDLADAVLARLQLSGGEEGVVYDAMWERGFCGALLDTIARRRRLRSEEGEVRALPQPLLRRLWQPSEGPLEPHIVRAEQSNASVVFGDRFILKLYRRLEAGLNPDREIGQFLTQRAAFAHTAPLAGALEYRHGREEPLTLGILQQLVQNEGDAWEYTLDALWRFFERPLDGEDGAPAAPTAHVLELAAADPPELADETIGGYLQAAELLGRRTAEMHLALASAPDDPAFAPEPMSAMDQRSLYQSMRTLTRRTLSLLRRRMRDLPEDLVSDAQALLDSEADILGRCQALLDERITAARTRVHGDYHLGQVLFTGRDFVIIDFEGEPLRPIGERRLKRTPLRDVAGMLRSFDYAAQSALLSGIERGEYPPLGDDRCEQLHRWAGFWNAWVGAAFLRTYLQTAEGAPFLPTRRRHVRTLLDASLLEKAIYEVSYELANRPGWVRIPLGGIRGLLDAPR